MRKILILSALFIFSCSDDSNDNSNQTFLERYDGVFWFHLSLVDNGDPFFNPGCFFKITLCRILFFLQIIPLHNWHLINLTHYFPVL